MAYTSYNDIGTNYDATRKADPYLCKRLVALLDTPAGGHLLDIGCGTGNYTMALMDRGYRMSGVEPSEQMLGTAKAKSLNIEWRNGSAERLPFSDQHFNGATAVLTTHHWDDIEQGFKEIHRVLEPGSKLVLLTSTPEQTGRYWLAHYFPKMIAASCTALPTLEATANALRHAGFRNISTEKYEVRPDLQDLFLYSRKHDPKSYLDERFRMGSSSFAALANRAEIEAGLVLLNDDIESGHWSMIKERYVHDQGDYLFVAAERT